MYKGIFWFLIPFVILIFLVDSYNFSVFTVLGIAFLVFVPITKQNEKRLEALIKSRKELKEKPGSEIRTNLEKKSNKVDESEAAYIFPGTSINMGSNSFFLTLMFIFMTWMLSYPFGWDHAITKSFLYVTIALLVFSFWFPYSKFVDRQVEVHDEFLKIGKRILSYGEIREIVCRSNGTILEFHLTYTNEPINIRPENEYQQEAWDFLKEWCPYVDIPFTEIGK